MPQRAKVRRGPQETPGGRSNLLAICAIEVTHGAVDSLPAALRVIGGQLLQNFGLLEGFRADMRVP